MSYILISCAGRSASHLGVTPAVRESNEKNLEMLFMQTNVHPQAKFEAPFQPTA
jgi:hypothetical protein